MQGAVDPGVPAYGGTFGIDVSLNALGTFSLGLFDDPNETFLIDLSGADIPIASLLPAIISVVDPLPNTSCCLPVDACAVLSEAECTAIGGEPTVACLGDGNMDGSDDACVLPNCDDPDSDDNPACPGASVPTVSHWGLVILALLLLAAAKIVGQQRGNKTGLIDME